MKKTPSAKPANYYSNVRSDIVDFLQTGHESSVLELGCGEGGTGRAILEAGKAGRYVGIELDESSAEIARKALSDVIVGDVAKVDLSAHLDQYDVLIMSEVVEHLQEPWTALERLVKCVKIDGMILASSPNVAHWRIIARLLAGHFEYKSSGVMDRTHLRWFTPESYRELFSLAGVDVLSIRAHNRLGTKSEFFATLTFGTLNYLTMSQMMLIGRRRS